MGHARAHVNAIGTATPPHDVHFAFRMFIEQSIEERRERALFQRMADRSGIEHRFSYCEPVIEGGKVIGDTEGFYGLDAFPSTAERMRKFEACAPQLAMKALADLPMEVERERITH